MTSDNSYVSDKSKWGQAEGSGVERTYVTKPGDTLDDVAAFFYGDASHRQRLIDDNPELSRWQSGDQVPGGTRIKVSEDAARGDTVSSSE
jgi:hypothetical protein